VGMAKPWIRWISRISIGIAAAAALALPWALSTPGDSPSRMGRNIHSLRTLSPDVLAKARDDTAAQVSRILLTFVGAAAFCLLSLLSPDSALLGGSEKLNVPLAGPVSFFGFMLLGPAILIVLRVYLQIYVEHADRLDRLARRMPVVRAPTLLPLKNPLIRSFSSLTSYLLLPVAILALCLEGSGIPRLGIGSFLRGGRGNHRSCNTATPQGLLAIKGTTEPGCRNPRRGNSCRGREAWFRASAPSL
jgi:hypothetical protein